MSEPVDTAAIRAALQDPGDQSLIGTCLRLCDALDVARAERDAARHLLDALGDTPSAEAGPVDTWSALGCTHYVEWEEGGPGAVRITDSDLPVTRAGTEPRSLLPRRPTLRADLEARAAYVTLTAEEVARTVDLDGWVMVDLDAFGQAVGVEILTVPAPLLAGSDHPPAAAEPGPEPTRGGAGGAEA